MAELLETHDCVIIPDFGGFVCNYAPAQVNRINNRFDPPCRKITFNRFLIHNDGLLANYLATQLDESYKNALSRVKSYVVYLKTELRENGRISFENIGVLHRAQDGTLRFEQVDNALLFKEGFGLDSFFARKIARGEGVKAAIEPKAAVEQVVPATETKNTEAKKTTPSPVKEAKPEKQGAPYSKLAIAAALGLPVAAYLAYLLLATPLFKSNQPFHASDLNPFGEKICPEYCHRQQVPSFDLPVDLSSGLKLEGDYMVLKLDNEPDKTLVVKLTDETDRVADLHYHVIGGCFGEYNNALRMVNRFRKLGNNASVVDQKGALHRVSVGSYATKREAVQALENIRQEIPNAWILYK